eukprot:scaffold3644_cov58-Attheya_sp.AAC.2
MTFFGRHDDEDLMLPALEAVMNDLAPHIISFLARCANFGAEENCLSLVAKTLRDAVNKYVKYDPDDAEALTFQGKKSFNELIGSCNVSNARNMESIFYGAQTFN